MGHTPDDDGREVFAAVLPGSLDGGDFALRHAREEDVPLVVELVDDEMRRRLTLPAVVDVSLTRQMVLHGGALLIVDAATDLPQGGIRLFLHGDAVELGYWLAPGARGRGLATRALRLVSAAVVARLQPSRLELRTTLGNTPSERVAERAGFERVGPEPPIEYPAGRVVETTLWTLELDPVESASGAVVDDAPLHPAGDGDDLAADVPGEDVRGQHHHLGRDVLGSPDLPQRHRP